MLMVRSISGTPGNPSWRSSATASATRRVKCVCTEAPSETAERDLRGVRVEPDLAAQEVIRVQPAQDEVRVGHGRLAPALAVAGRPRFGAGALGPHAQEAPVVDPPDRAAPRTDGGE